MTDETMLFSNYSKQSHAFWIGCGAVFEIFQQMFIHPTYTHKIPALVSLELRF